jgi:hypothetical protein
MVSKSKGHRGGAEVRAQRVVKVNAAEDAGDERGDAGAPGGAGADRAGRADAREGATCADEGRLLVALQLGEGTPMDVVDRSRVQCGSRGHSRG